MATMALSSAYHEDSDADDEYEDIMSPPPIDTQFPRSPSESNPPSTEQTPTTYTHTGNEESSLNPLTQWSAEQCADFVSSLDLEEYGDAFVDEAVDGAALSAMGHDDLKELEITSMGHRLTILKSVYDLKLKQNIRIDPDHYVPLSADANSPDATATQDDILRIFNAIKLRDERIQAAEADLRLLRDDLARVSEENKRLREETLPVIRMVKDRLQPLPTPDGLSHEQPTSPHPSMLKREITNKSTFITAKMPSETVQEVGSNLDPSPAALQASSNLGASMGNGNATSPHTSQQPSPTSPPYIGQQNFNSRAPRSDSMNTSRAGHQQQDEHWTWSNASTVNGDQRDRDIRTLQTPTTRRPGTASTITGLSTADDAPGPVSAAGSSEKPPEIFKSFRVSMEDPCHKVLPAALKKYKIEDDWRQYSLYIVYGDQERCLGWEERPLILFKQLDREGKKPMLMLRKHAAPAEGFTTTNRSGGMGGLTSPPGNRPSTVPIPGGVF